MLNKEVHPDSNKKNLKRTKVLNSVKDFTRLNGQILYLDPADYMKLPYPYDDWVDPPIKELTDDQKSRLEHSLDGLSAIAIPVPGTEAEKEERGAEKAV
jgi:hypothetical protein